MSCHQEELGISPKTIEKYDEHIKIKLGYADAEALHRGAREWFVSAQIFNMKTHDLICASAYARDGGITENV